MDEQSLRIEPNAGDDFGQHERNTIPILTLYGSALGIR